MLKAIGQPTNLALASTEARDQIRRAQIGFPAKGDVLGVGPHGTPEDRLNNAVHNSCAEAVLSFWPAPGKPVTFNLGVPQGDGISSHFGTVALKHDAGSPQLLAQAYGTETATQFTEVAMHIARQLGVNATFSEPKYQTKPGAPSQFTDGF